MKKLVFVLAVVASASLFSCGNSEKATEAAQDSAVVVEEVAVAVDTVVPVDTVAAVADSAAVVAE